jgi:hypothetical protein
MKISQLILDAIQAVRDGKIPGYRLVEIDHSEVVKPSKETVGAIVFGANSKED